MNNITFGGTDAVAAALSTNFIHIVDLEAKKSKKCLDFPQNVVGIHFDLSSSPGFSFDFSIIIPSSSSDCR